MLGNAFPSAALKKGTGTAQVAPLLLIALFVAVVGCSPAEKIEQYRVDKPEVLAKQFSHGSDADASPTADTSPTDRMLAAIVPHGSQFWFFKLAGPDDAVRTHGKEFLQLMFSLHFADGAESPPDWTLPEGWTREPGNQMRYATLVIAPGPPRLEVSVSTFPKPSGESETIDAILLNVNRWRGQMGLSPITKDQLADETKQLPLGGETATFVSLVGKLGKGGMTPPFARGALPLDHPSLPPDHPELPPDHPAIPARRRRRIPKSPPRNLPPI